MAIVGLLCCLCLPLLAQPALAQGTVPSAASAVGRELDRQLAERVGAAAVSLTFTTPVDVNDMEQANPLARQVQEELARWFVQAGYDVYEIRKGRDILFEPRRGETLLTRKEDLLGSRKVPGSAIVAGTYTVTPYNVRFNIRIVSTANRETLGMSTITIPMDPEVASLIRVRVGAGGRVMPIQPTVVTLLP
ncbi:hypothetical protein LJC59_09570 [Desulfovibrio sp. OttesenSCG-928-A18]|nr:hypothetical protein [Desulfovibrio sp. OttesenSCG-928-A18]